MNFVIYTRYMKEKSIIPPFTLLFSLATFPLFRHSPPRHSSLVTRHFFCFFRHYIPPLKVACDSWVCAPREIFITFSSSFVSRHSSFFPFFRLHIPPLLGRSLRIGEYVIGVRIPFPFASKPRFYHFLCRCIIL